MKKILFFWLLCFLPVIVWCKRPMENSRNFTYIKDSSSDIYITWEIYDTYPSLSSKYAEWSLYLSPDKSEICYMTWGKFACVAKLSQQLIITDNKKDMSWYIQIIKKSDVNFIGLNYILDKSGKRVFLEYNEPNTNPLLKRNSYRFIVDLQTFQIHKINGGQTSQPYNVQLIDIQGNYLIYMDWDWNNNNMPNYSIEDYTIGRWYYSYFGTWWIIDPVAMTVTYKSFLPKCSQVDSSDPRACDPNNDNILRRSETATTQSFKPQNK